MNRLRRGIGCFVVCLAFPGVTLAGPVQPEQIPADASWFGHFNMDAVRAIPGFEGWMDQCASHPGIQARLAAWTDKFGLNPREDLLGVTLFSSHYAGGTGVALIHVRALDRDKLLAALAQHHPDFVTATHGSRTLYSWTARDRRGEKQLTGAFGNEQTLVIGTGTEEVKRALDTLDGKKPAQPGTSPLLAGAAPNALFVARGVGVTADDRAATRCPVLRSSEGAFVQWQQADGMLSGEYHFEATDAEKARAFQTVVDGMVALAKLRGGNSQPVARLLEGLTYSANGSRFDLTWEAPLGELRQMMEQFKGECPVTPR